MNKWVLLTILLAFTSCAQFNDRGVAHTETPSSSPYACDQQRYNLKMMESDEVLAAVMVSGFGLCKIGQYQRSPGKVFLQRRNTIVSEHKFPMQDYSVASLQNSLHSTEVGKKLLDKAKSFINQCGCTN